MAKKSKKSFKRKHPADAANAFVRNLLCEISEHFGGISSLQWSETLIHFDGKCAYTGEDADVLVQEHVIPHNTKHCGLHVYGNIVPALSSANAAKSDKTLEEFMKKNHKYWINKSVEQDELDKRKDKILEFMKKSKYLTFHEDLFSKISEEIRKNYELILAMADKNKFQMLQMLGNDFKLQKKGVDNSSINSNENSQIITATITDSENDELLKSIRSWKRKPNGKVHKIVDKIINNPNGIDKNQLLAFISIDCDGKNPEGTLASMKTNKGNSYGRILFVENDIVKLVPELETDIINIWKN